MCRSVRRPKGSRSAVVGHGGLIISTEFVPPHERPEEAAVQRRPGAIGIDPSALATLHTIFARHPEIRRVLLFGSRASGAWHEHSDADLAVDGEIDFAGLLRLHKEIAALGLPWEADLIRFRAKHPPAFMAELRRHSQVIYAVAEAAHNRDVAGESEDCG